MVLYVIKHTWDMLVIPKTKHIASRMLDLPDPLRPVMALKEGSHPVIWVLTGYDLKPKSRLFRFTEQKIRRAFDNKLLYPHRCSAFRLDFKLQASSQVIYLV